MVDIVIEADSSNARDIAAILTVALRNMCKDMKAGEMKRFSCGGIQFFCRHVGTWTKEDKTDLVLWCDISEGFTFIIARGLEDGTGDNARKVANGNLLNETEELLRKNGASWTPVY